MITLENDYLQIEIKNIGAELCKVYSKQTNLDYLWKGDPKFWKRHSPVLFPIVGKLVNNFYTINRTKYELNQHGFARDLEFNVITKTNESILFEAEYTQETLLKYPYKFTLQIGYQLKKNLIEVTYEVFNKDDKSINFSIGAHPAFNCPISESSSFNDYFIEFEKEENPIQHSLNPQTGFRKKDTERVRLNKTIPLSYNLFDNDAIMFEGLESKQISLKSNKHEHGVHFYIPNWRYMAFWTQKGNAPFVCFEPWMGIADEENTDQVFETKTGIMSLNIGETYTNEYAMEFF
ncbi:Galactose mutarotase [Tenacibaculum sp. MAR_2009_124]|uniref:aldose 1-epimerase family protein n=1 Tax=Tenacibaculum sp. MAR_2009_124 TaxID=1250059 RepID=UPI0008963977|nr:aldose 1-epimerase family protein [Tenacibaculum sp. MAR_2009_124]SEC92169.1 Galactose mutarotase [Tenacibaculum sp. MAR_2009_124]